MRIRDLMIGAMALVAMGMGQPEAEAAMGITPGTTAAEHYWPYAGRSGGSLAHRKWRKLRSSGRR